MKCGIEIRIHSQYPHSHLPRMYFCMGDFKERGIRISCMYVNFASFCRPTTHHLLESSVKIAQHWGLGSLVNWEPEPNPGISVRINSGQWLVQLVGWSFLFTAMIYHGSNLLGHHNILFHFLTLSIPCTQKSTRKNKFVQFSPRFFLKFGISSHDEITKHNNGIKFEIGEGF